jgi:hypothetical protein
LPPQNPIKIAVSPAKAYESHRALFDMLSFGLNVVFEPFAPGACTDLRGLIVLESDPAGVRGANENGLSSYQVYSAATNQCSEQSEIAFESSLIVHAAFRNKSLRDAGLETYCQIPESAECLARVDGRPVWSVSQRGNQQTHTVGIDLPPFLSGEQFTKYFRSSRWFSMLPLLHFLRHLLGPEGWLVPEPRAAFIIDDPNLHGRRYGYIDFAGLVKHAEAHKYHATIATVPLDAWYFDSNVAGLFRTHKKQISLMMHGVNHIADELARGYTDEESLALLAAGLRRIAAFESRSGLTVGRVMAAPHGAFADSIANPMLRLGFEAACVSIGSLVHWNPDKSWPVDLGLPPVQPLGSLGLPVFHRTGTNETDVRLSAFLGHPVVIATHHQDCVANFARFEELANVVNQIVDVRWTSIENISRTNYVSRVDGEMLCVTPYSRRLEIQIPQGIVVCQLQTSPFCREMTIDLRQQRSNSVGEKAGAQYYVSNSMLHLHLPAGDPIDYRGVSAMRLGPWPVLRRILAEARDRAKPKLSFA